MVGRLLRLLSKERDLRMIWEVEKAGRRSYLVGTAHFFPYHFGSSLRRRIGRAETVLLEGPLEEEAMRRVVGSGSGSDAAFSLYDALDARTVRRIHRELGTARPALSSHELYRDLFGGGREDVVGADVRGLKPWMAFFRIWTHYLRRNGWRYTMDLDASRIAAELNKEVRHLETIEEQIEALEGIPLERIVDFLTRADWNAYRRAYVRQYLSGDLAGVMARARAFPTFCEAILNKRDPILCERIGRVFRKGNAIAFVGVLHCQGITMRLREEGYRVGPPSEP